MTTDQLVGGLHHRIRQCNSRRVGIDLFRPFKQGASTGIPIRIKAMPEARDTLAALQASCDHAARSLGATCLTQECLDALTVPTVACALECCQSCHDC